MTDTPDAGGGIKKVTKMPPKTLAIVIAAGIVLGLYLRSRKAKTTAATVATSSPAAGTDLTGYGLASSANGPTTGYANSTGSGSYYGTSPTGVADTTVNNGVPTPIEGKVLSGNNVQDALKAYQNGDPTKGEAIANQISPETLQALIGQ